MASRPLCSAQPTSPPPPCRARKPPVIGLVINNTASRDSDEFEATRREPQTTQVALPSQQTMRVLLLAALAHTSSAFAPPTRPLHATKPQRPTAVAALPSLPGWVPSLPAGTGQVAGDLSLFTVKTLIAWGVPAFVVALVVFPLADAIFGGDDEDRKSQLEGGAFGDEFALEDEQPQPPGLPFGRKKPRRAPNRPKAPQYLKVERLNERLESFEFSLESASSGRYAARKARRNRRLGKAFGDELGLAGLSDDASAASVFLSSTCRGDGVLDAYAVDATPRAASRRRRRR